MKLLESSRMTYQPDDLWIPESGTLIVTVNINPTYAIIDLRSVFCFLELYLSDRYQSEFGFGQQECLDRDQGGIIISFVLHLSPNEVKFSHFKFH